MYLQNLKSLIPFDHKLLKSQSIYEVKSETLLKILKYNNFPLINNKIFFTMLSKNDFKLLYNIVGSLPSYEINNNLVLIKSMITYLKMKGEKVYE